MTCSLKKGLINTLIYLGLFDVFVLHKLILSSICIIHEHESNLYSIFAPQIRSTI